MIDTAGHSARTAMGHHCIRQALIPLIGLSIVGCGTIPSDLREEVDVACRLPELTAPIEATAILAPGMRLDVSVAVAGEEELRTDQTPISEQGLLSLPMIGEVPAAGLTPAELEHRLTERYAEYFVAPGVRLDVPPTAVQNPVSPGYVTVLGRVRSPGRVPVPATRDLTVLQAISAVGGLNTSARQRRVQVVRRTEPDGRPLRIRVNLKRIADGQDRDEDLLLQAGDVVYVPEAWL